MIHFGMIIDFFQRNMILIFLDFLLTFIYIGLFKITENQYRNGRQKFTDS
uniref:Uncharacterized protein n=1 Tax=Tetranychus urticae TaxID=32264 RepID=T1KIS0_TETUR